MGLFSLLKTKVTSSQTGSHTPVGQPYLTDSEKLSARLELKVNTAAAEKVRAKHSRGLNPRVAAIRAAAS